MPAPFIGIAVAKNSGLPGTIFLGLAHVRDDLLVRLPGAGADAGQRQRGAHQLQEAAAADRIEPLRGVLRELAMEEFLEFGGLGQRLRGCASSRGRACPPGGRAAPSMSLRSFMSDSPVARRAAGARLDAVFLHQLRPEHRLRRRRAGTPSS